MDDLEREIDFVGIMVAQYQIDSEIPLVKYDFQDKEMFSSFFKQFAEYANLGWKSKTNCDWDFSKFPYRESSDTIKGLYRILKTGGAYTQDTGAPYSDEESTRIEEKFRRGFQKDSELLFIFGIMKEDTRGEDLSGGFGVPDEFLDCKEISEHFELVAWDDLIFIINPEYNTLYVIAYTDTD